MNCSFSRLLLSFLFICFLGIASNAQTRNGLVITKDDNGVIREKGKVVRDRREGEWNFYNAQGKLEQQTNYAGGKKNGVELHFFQGDTISLGHYKNDVQVGEWKKWDNSFHLISLQHYDENGNPTGISFKWEGDGSLKEYSVITTDGKETLYEYSLGKILRISHYSGPRLDGRMIIYNVNNKLTTDSIQEIREYKEGQQHGESIEYLKGKIIHKANYCNGFLCGESTWYDAEGRITISRTYDSLGRIDGVEKEYENGKLVAETNYVKGARNGKQVFFNASGVLMMESYFTMERLDSSFKYYANASHSLREKVMGAQESLYPFYFDTTYYENGNLKTTFTWQSPGTTLEGPYTLYYPNGKPQTLKTYKSNSTDGIYKEWNREGTLILHAVCRKNELADSIRVWKEDGTEIDSKSADFDRAVFRAMQTGMSFYGKIPADMKITDPKFTELPPPARTEYLKADSLSSFENSAVYTFAEVMPVFPNDGFMAYLSKNIKYPAMEKEAGMQGTVYVSFIITSKGTVAGVKCVKEVQGATGLSKESIRVIRAMPVWSPGMNNGKPVNVRMVQPIRFTLK